MKSKSLIAVSIFALGILSPFDIANVSAAYTPTAGDIIKTTASPALYYIDTDAKRRLYVNEATFWTWYGGTWSNIQLDGKPKAIKVISQDEFDALATSANVTARPGSGLIKFENSSQLYQVTDHGKLKLLSDTAEAQQLFGANWNSKVIAIQAGFEGDYTKNTVSSPVSSESAWQIFQQYLLYAKNHDINGMTGLEYQTNNCDGVTECYTTYSDYIYTSGSQFKESDFVNKWEDAKQVVLSTNPQVVNSMEAKSYDRTYLYFVKDVSSKLKILKIEQKSWGHTTNTSLTSSEIEQEIQKMMRDTDQDGLTDQEETCGGASQYRSDCVKTNPNNRDTNDNGWWDSVDKTLTK